jgi:dolichyl-phosphate beta-glucosyltransferase
MNISLIVPCYNEELNIQKGVLDRIGEYTASDIRFKEVLIVDDGSTDKSKPLIKEKYISLFPKFRLIENAHQGKAFAIIRGIQESQSDFVMFSDIDLATPIEEADKLIQGATEGFDVIIGSRSSNREGAPLLRKVMALGMIFLRSYIVGLKGIRDTQCGFKMFKRTTGLDIILKLRVFHNRNTITGSSVSAGFDLEFLFLAQKLGYKIKEISVIWRHVETKNVNFVRDSIESLKDILRIKYYEITGKYNT